MDYRRMIIALAVVVLVLVSAAPMAAETDADDTPEIYGTTFGIDQSKIDEFLKEITGKTLEELLESLAKDLTGHDFKITPAINSSFALSRNVRHDGGTMDITDRLAGYLLMACDIESDGSFPPAGKYLPKEGESNYDFVKRVMTTESTEQHHIQYDMTIVITIDIQVETVIDSASGEVLSVYISFYPSMMLYITGNMSVDLDIDDEGNFDSLTIDYSEMRSSNDIYGDFQIQLAVDDLKVLGDGSWECKPTITASAVKAVVSKDMVGDIWNLIESQIDEKVDSPILGLLINIVEIVDSTEKKVDLFKIIESLTGNRFHDLIFVADATVTDVTDESGDRYAVIEIARSGGLEVIHLPLAGYKVTISDILNIIPDSVISKDIKALIESAAEILGWKSIEVGDISDDPEMQKNIDKIYQLADEYNKWNEYYEFDLPLIYIVAAAVITAIALAAAVLMWRGRI